MDTDLDGLTDQEEAVLGTNPALELPRVEVLEHARSVRHVRRGERRGDDRRDRDDQNDARAQPATEPRRRAIGVADVELVAGAHEPPPCGSIVAGSTRFIYERA